ncbi:uncharacterized protein LOC111088945 [Limulus polyphemus]|uniref:Uncharacterized protein LOC111088945 n=1 Tax=Limulus polyphemus TaxID=6850 RepID=A0ABM1TJJ6_LIMPO|nr:uncharacterized protein LOC111088945 [Limulus polyphemus]
MNNSSLQYSPTWKNRLVGLTSESFLEARERVTKRHLQRKQELEAKVREEEERRYNLGVRLGESHTRVPGHLPPLLKNDVTIGRHNKEKSRIFEDFVKYQKNPRDNKL